MIYDLIVIGGGAGGCFASIRLAEALKGAKVVILEAGRKPLSKVEVSGGGRCNVTHACFDPEDLVRYYPRGQKELLGPFYHFQPGDMIGWLEKNGIKLKEEEDGRMFPVTDSSQTIIDCFLRAMTRYEIDLRTSTRALSWEQDKASKQWLVTLQGGEVLQSRCLLIASGSDQRTWDHLKASGHTIIPPVPSLFTFNIRDKQLTSLLGISRPDTIVRIPQFKLQSEGPLLITHWGLSGPAILKLSAWGARELYQCNYVFDVHVNWTGMEDHDTIGLWLSSLMSAHPRKQITNIPTGLFPSRLWAFLCLRSRIPEGMQGSALQHKEFDSLVKILSDDVYRVTGKSTFKEEFVTAGGIDLKNIDLRRFESKIQPDLFIVGEVLNIDALTGGFNFQAAWTGAALAAEAMAERCR